MQFYLYFLFIILVGIVVVLIAKFIPQSWVDKCHSRGKQTTKKKKEPEVRNFQYAVSVDVRSLEKVDGLRSARIVSEDLEATEIPKPGGSPPSETSV